MTFPSDAAVQTLAFRPEFRLLERVGVTLCLWVATFVPPLLLMIGVALQPWVPIADLLRDPLAVAELSTECCKVHFGAISNAGVLVWWSAAAVCLFTGAVLYSLGRPVAESAFLLSAGVLTGLLATDDLFLVHDHILPAFGVPQPAVYAAYGACGLAHVLFFRRHILDHRMGLFSAAVLLLSTSVAVDWLIESDEPARIVIEDGAKLLGIFAWTSFHLTAAGRAIARNAGLAR